MLPSNFRYWLFDTLSVQPMRYVDAVPMHRANGLTKNIFKMINEDFFRNGSLTSRSKVPELMAAIWMGGREAMLVEDKVDRTTKDAITAVLSRINDCPYCEDMLISLVHAAGDHKTASDIYAHGKFDGNQDLLGRRLRWILDISTKKSADDLGTPFTERQLPEVIGTLMGMHDINRFSHVVMSDTAVPTPFGMRKLKDWALRLFAIELKATRSRSLEPGRSLSLLPPAELPPDMQWAKPNPRIADAVSRWTAAVERESAVVIPPRVKKVVLDALARWDGLPMPLSADWIKQDLQDLEGRERQLACFAIVVAKASYRTTPKMVEEVMGEDRDQERFIRILAWSSFSAARRLAQVLSEKATAGLLVSESVKLVKKAS